MYVFIHSVGGKASFLDPIILRQAAVRGETSSHHTIAQQITTILSKTHQK